MYHFFVK